MRMRLAMRLAKGLLVTGGLLAAGLCPAMVTLPWSDDFSDTKLKAPWVVHLSAGSQLEVTNRTLIFTGPANAMAAAEYPLPVQQARVQCQLKGSSGEVVTDLVLTWDNSNYLQFGLNHRGDGHLNLREVLGTYPHDFDLGPMDVTQWHTLAVELGQDCVRYLVSTDEVTFACVHVSPRPARIAGALTNVSLARKVERKIFARPVPWTIPPTVAPTSVVAFQHLQITALSATAAHRSSREESMLRDVGQDAAGNKELARKEDPSFDSVSHHFPRMKWSREIVGVKDHPGTIGVAPDGSLEFGDDLANYTKATAFFRLGDYRFGTGTNGCAKRLLNGWVPAVTAQANHGGLQLEQTVFGWSEGFSPDQPMYGYVLFRAKNWTAGWREVSLQLAGPSVTNKNSALRWHLEIPAGGSQMVAVRLSSEYPKGGVSEIPADEFAAKLNSVADYWSQLIGQGGHFEIPELRVQNAFRAWQAYNYLNVAKRDGRFDVCDGSGFYGRVYGYSAALYCHALDLLGEPDQAAIYCDSLLTYVHTNGLLAVNFGDTDTGTTLWMMAEHYRLTRDRTWLLAHAAKMQLMCQWIVAQRHAALKNVAQEPLVTRGLIRYRPYADLLHPAADYFSNVNLWHGLDATANVFAEVGLEVPAAELRREAASYAADIQASMKAAIFKDGDMKILPMIPENHELWRESDGSADGYYGIIASCLLDAGLPAGDDPKAKLIVKALETRGGLVAGVSQFHQMADHAYAFGYWNNCLQRDDVRRAILGLYGSLAYGMSRDTYAAVECTAIRTGENYWMLPHTFSTTQQIRLLRNMLVREGGNTLWLGQAIPRDWLAAGKHVAVLDAPTVFGPVSYRIEPQADGSMRVQLTPPVREPPKEIRLRLRDPSHRRIAHVTANGPVAINFSSDTLRLTHCGQPVVFAVTFK